MRIAYFDAVGGAAGDMILGAMIDAGLPLADLESELAKLSLPGYRLTEQKVHKQQIAATQFLVNVEGEDHHHHDHDGGGHEEHGRSLSDIQQLITSSGLNGRIKGRALDIFHRLGVAEAKVHGVDVSDVHFHEVGTIDSVVDVVGAAIGLDLLGIERVYCSPLPVGSGMVQTKHGLYPIPAPATLELLAEAGAPIATSSMSMEQVTPTGAAILTAVATFERPAMSVDRVGYGSGEADLPIPNVLRVWLGEAQCGVTERSATSKAQEIESENLMILETNIDDMNPELYSYVLERLMGAGALDALLVPVIMKKGRPGVKIEVLCRQAEYATLLDILMAETSTLGVRARGVSRVAAERDVVHVDTAYGSMAVKVKRWQGRAVAAVPEYADAVRIAEQLNVPALEAYNEAARAGRALLDHGE